MNVTISLTNAQATRLVNVLCAKFNYSATVSNSNFDPELPESPDTNPKTIPNPETDKAFAKRMILEQIKEWVRAEEIRKSKRISDHDIDSSFVPLDLTIN